jgi:hypothetical protein|tara:strand:- start:156 stop:329 length:174 start_codon:yes stop_codon:yes gene_type:complete
MGVRPNLQGATPHTARRRDRSALLVGRQKRLEVLEEVDRGGGLLVVIFLDAAVQVDL